MHNIEKWVNYAAGTTGRTMTRNELFDQLCQVMMIKVSDLTNNDYFSKIKNDPKETWLRFNKCRNIYRLATEHLGMFKQFTLGKEEVLELMGRLDKLHLLETEYDPFSMLFNYCINFKSKRDALGQFHTPYHVVELMVELNLGEVEEVDRPQVLLEPTCGVGTMCVVAWKKFPHLFDPMESIWGIDVDFISTLGARYNFAAWGLNPANVICGDGLRDPAELKKEHFKNLEKEILKVDRVAILKEIDEINEKLVEAGYSLKG